MKRRTEKRWAVLPFLSIAYVGLVPPVKAQGTAEISVGAYTTHLTGTSGQIDGGVSVNFRQLYPGFGLVSGSLNAANSASSLRRGASFLQSEGVPLPAGTAGFTVGDTQLELDQIFDNHLPGYFLPSLSLSGFSTSLQMSGKRLEVFHGAEYILAGPQITQRLGTDQQISGFLSSWKMSRTVTIGIRLLILNSRSSAQSWLVNNISAVTAHSQSVANQISWNPAPSFQLFGELAESWSHFRIPLTQKQRVSTLAGMHWYRPSFQVAGTYLSQAVDYLPIAGSYLGSRQGVIGQFRIRPRAETELFGSASNLESTVSLSPLVVQDSRMVSLGWNTVWDKFNFSGSWTNLSAHSGLPNGTEERRANQLFIVNASRQWGGQTIRLGWENLKILTTAQASSQQVTELEDGVQWRHLHVGGALRLERQQVASIRNQLAVRTFWNGTWRFLSAYGSFEAGSDLGNSSLLTKTGTQTTTLGLVATIRRNWQLRADTYRSKLLLTFDPQNVALLEQNGVGPATILNSNQWTSYLRLSKTFSWKGGLSMAHVAEIAKNVSMETGTVEGQVEGGHGPNRKESLAGIPVQLDRSRFVLTDYQGIYRFTNVAEGRHVIGLDTWHLPAEYEPAAETERTVLVESHHSVSADFALDHLGAIQGTIEGLPPSSAVVLELEGDQVLTTPENDGHFAFQNIKEGVHKIRIQAGSIPVDYKLIESPHDPVVVTCHTESLVKFVLAYSPKAKPVRTIYLNGATP